MDPLAKAYLKVITESCDDLQKKDQKVASTLKVGATFGNSESDSLSKKFQSKSGPEAKGATTLETPQEAENHLSVGKDVDGKAKPLKSNYGESKNPFDVLFNRIIAEEGEMMDFSTSASPENSTFEPSFGDSEGEDTDEFGETEGESEKVTFELDKDLAEKLFEALSAVLNEGGEDEDGDGGEEGEDFGGEDDFGGEGEEEEESSEGGAKPFGEAVESEDGGTPLVDEERLSHGLNKKGSDKLKSAVPVTKKSAQTPATGKGHDGKLKAHSTEGGVSKLTGKDNKVGGVTVGKTIYDQN